MDIDKARRISEDLREKNRVIVEALQNFDEHESIEGLIQELHWKSDTDPQAIAILAAIGQRLINCCTQQLEHLEEQLEDAGSTQDLILEQQQAWDSDRRASCASI